jgi:DNA polymerase III subunit epsilon
MKPAVKYWIFLFAIANVIFGVILASLFGSWFNLSETERDFVLGIAEKILPFPLLGAVIILAAIGTLVSLLFRYYIIPTLQMAEETRLITAVNPDYRIAPKGARELVRLAEVINASAEAYQRLQTDVEATIASAKGELYAERNRLAALMSELPFGVLVCNTDGQILLYNAQAQRMLQPSGPQLGAGSSGWIGLGRSIFGVLHRDPIVHALELLQQAVERGQLAPTTGFMMTLRGGVCLRLSMAPVFSDRCEEHDHCLRCGKRDISGIVLTLQDMTPQIEADTRRDLLIQSLTDDVQGALGEIRQAITTILGQPELGKEELHGYRQTIDRASRSLQAQLAQARENYARHLQALSKVEEVLAENLLEVLQRNIAERFALEVECRAAEGLWLKLDSYATVQALSHLAGLLKHQGEVERLQLSLQPGIAGQAELTLAWPQGEVAAGLIADWAASPLMTDPQGRLLSVRELIAQHGGAIAPTQQRDGCCGGVCLGLPAQARGERVEFAAPQGPRPVYYAFDLFHQRGSAELRQRPLRQLTFVVFDTETTGLHPAEGDEIIQIGAVRIVNDRLLHDEAIDQLIDPRRPVPVASVAIHGIQPELLAGQPTIDQVLPHFHQFAAGAVLVAHNAAFDMRFLQLKEAASGVRFDQPVLDTLLLSSIVHPHLGAHALDDIAERLNLTILGRHTALGDALVTAEVLLKLIPLLEAQGIHTLAEALEASAASPFNKLSY